MERILKEMAKAESDVEKRIRAAVPEIIRECAAFAYLGKYFTFDASQVLYDDINRRLISLSDDILEDIEARALNAIEYADAEEDTEAILTYIKREIGEEDMLTRLDKHSSSFRHFLEGWIAIGLANRIGEQELTSYIFTFMGNPEASPMWRKAKQEGYLAEAISGGYVFGTGNQKNSIDALADVERYAINEAFQYGKILGYGRKGAIGYTIHRGSGYDCPFCDSNCGFTIPLDDIRLPQHPRCMCYSRPVFR